MSEVSIPREGKPPLIARFGGFLYVGRKSQKFWIESQIVVALLGLNSWTDS